MSNIGGLRTLESLSPDKHNAMGVVKLTSSEMAALPITTQVGLIHCLDTGNGFVKDVIYKPIYDGSFNRTAFVPVVQAHDHSANDDVSGGSLIDIYYANGDKAALIDYYKINISEFRLFGSFSGGGVGFDDSEADTTSVSLSTGITPNNNLTIQGDGIRLLFSSKMRWDFRMRASHNSGITLRAGVNIDRLDQSQSTSRRQIGVEGCAGHGTNWVIISANGNSGNLTATQTLLPINSVADLYSMLFVPALEARLFYAGVSQAASPAGATPSNGNSDHDKLWRFGVQTTNSTQKKFNYWSGQQIGVPHAGF